MQNAPRDWGPGRRLALYGVVSATIRRVFRRPGESDDVLQLEIQHPSQPRAIRGLLDAGELDEWLRDGTAKLMPADCCGDTPPPALQVSEMTLTASVATLIPADALFRLIESTLGPKRSKDHDDSADWWKR